MEGMSTTSHANDFWIRLDIGGDEHITLDLRYGVPNTQELIEMTLT
jgi:hypothetical protein